MKKRFFPIFLSILIPFSFIVTGCSSEPIDSSESNNTSTQKDVSDVVQDESNVDESSQTESIDDKSDNPNGEEGYRRYIPDRKWWIPKLYEGVATNLFGRYYRGGVLVSTRTYG